MDYNRSPRSRGIMGSRPDPLKVCKDSRKIIKKPPLAPHLPQPQQPPPTQIHQQEPLQLPDGPVIIYTVSPKIIHTHPNDFMALVQRLTGKISTSATSSSSSTSTSAPRDTSSPFDASRGLISPAARFAATEKANTSNGQGFVGGVETMDQYYHHHHHHHHNHHQNRVMERPSFCHAGILSPGPTSLPSISPDFFSTVGPTTDPQGFSSFFNDFNSILQTSPSMVPSPSSMDLFNNFFDS
ncbi:Nuclear speckle RNA-binding protein B [Cardamine amara subsp. amara]|uniref:Nuclear speckle RNA-binding protein B n=1 Tax=Cardamine amara subsp. amara TaxID=228776 RepID=A0ABD0ZEZ8_CARAN